MKNCEKIKSLQNKNIETKDKKIIFNKNDLFYQFNNLLYQDSFYFDFNATENNENGTHDYPPLQNSLHSSQVLFPNTINSHREGTICFSIKALDEYTRIPIKNAKIQLQNVNLGQESITNAQGIAFLNIKESEYLKSFNATLIHKDYETIPICNRRIIPNAIRSREKPFELRFRGKALGI